MPRQLPYYRVALGLVWFGVNVLRDDADRASPLTRHYICDFRFYARKLGIADYSLSLARPAYAIIIRRRFLYDHFE